MDLNRLNVKFPVTGPGALQMEKIVPAFHRWIQDKLVDNDTLVDVANYDHVPNGPGVMLIGHRGDWAFDFLDGRPQFMYQRKRAMPAELKDKLRLALREALLGMQRLVDNPAPHGPIGFNTGEVSIALIDRLHAPNNEATWDAVRGDIEGMAREVFGDAAKAEWTRSDPRGNFIVRVTASPATDIRGLLDRLTPVAA